MYNLLVEMEFNVKLSRRDEWLVRYIDLIELLENVAIYNFLKPETNKDDFRLHFELKL